MPWLVKTNGVDGHVLAVQLLGAQVAAQFLADALHLLERIVVFPNRWHRRLARVIACTITGDDAGATT
jgi:hypothetical protein